MIAQTTIADILNNADATDLDNVVAALKQRRKALDAIRSSQITIGANVRIARIRPAYLNGLTGTVKASKYGKRGTFALALDTASAAIYKATARTVIWDDTVEGIPAQCFDLI